MTNDANFVKQKDEDEPTIGFWQRIKLCLLMTWNESSIVRPCFQGIGVLIVVIVIASIYFFIATPLGYLYSKYIILQNKETISFWGSTSIVSGCVTVLPHLICLIITQTMVPASNFDTWGNNYDAGIVVWGVHIVLWAVNWAFGVVPVIAYDAETHFFTVYGIFSGILLLFAFIDFVFIPICLDFRRFWLKASVNANVSTQSIQSQV